MISVRDTIPQAASRHRRRDPVDPARPQEFQHVAQMGASPTETHSRVMIEPTGASRSAPLTHPCRISVCIRWHDRHRLPAADEPDDVSFRDDPERSSSAPTTGAPEMR